MATTNIIIQILLLVGLAGVGPPPGLSGLIQTKSSPVEAIGAVSLIKVLLGGNLEVKVGEVVAN